MMMAATTIYNIRYRLTQVIVFVACVLFCMLISQVAEARKPKPAHFDKPKYRVCVHSNSQRVVKVLEWKRKNPYKQGGMFASSKRSKPRAQAEADF